MSYQHSAQIGADLVIVLCCLYYEWIVTPQLLGTQFVPIDFILIQVFTSCQLEPFSFTLVYWNSIATLDMCVFNLSMCSGNTIWIWISISKFTQVMILCPSALICHPSHILFWIHSTSQYIYNLKPQRRY